MTLAPAFLAHAFGQTYTLPIPLWLFLFAAAAAVLLSFVVVSIFVDDRVPASAMPPQKSLGMLVPIGKVLGVVLLWLALVSGWTSQFRTGFITVSFWIIFMLGFTYLTAFVGNIWDVLNPFRTLIEWIEKLLGYQFKGEFSLPSKLSYLPALLIYFGLIWLELLSDGFGVNPNNLALLLTVYTVLTVATSAIFGKEQWLKNGEFFTQFFRLVSKVSPIRIADGKYSFRKPFSGLLEEEPVNLWLLLFVLFMLASTGFDGLKETLVFHNFAAHIPGFLTNRGYYLHLTVWMLLAPLVLLGIYVFFVWLMKVLSGTTQRTFDLACRFAFSLIPIAIAYNMAHYLSLLYNQLLTYNKFLFDPFDQGWNLFGLAHPNVPFNQMNVKVVWYSQIFLIIVGHIVAVYIAHRMALRAFPDKVQARRSQYPLLALMVVYTVGSLWIIGQAMSVASR